MEELYLEHGALVPKEEWEAAIATIRHAARSSAVHDGNSVDSTKTRWRHAFEAAVLERVDAAEGKPLGVFFSGGVDSTLIAHTLFERSIPFTCYTVGFLDEGTKEPEDIVEAQRVAQAMGWRIVHRTYTLDEMERVVLQTIGILGDCADTVSVGVGSVVVAAAELAAKDGVDVLFSGLGSEEIFAGYERHEKALQGNDHTMLDEECWKGLTAMHARDLVRDTRIAAALKITVPTPFLDPAVIKTGMMLPASEKIKDGVKKAVLRAMSTEMGLPEVFAMRPKRAAQYGSRVDAALERLTRKAGCATKGDYIQSMLQRLRTETS